MVDLCGPRVLDKEAVRQQEFRIHSGKKKEEIGKIKEKQIQIQS